MERHTLAELIAPSGAGPHIAAALLPGRLCAGGLSFHSPGLRTHDGENPHAHRDAELFIIVQGRGVIECAGRVEPVAAGDVLLIHPGEDHHLIGDPEHPIINLWLHASAAGHPVQYPAGPAPEQSDGKGAGPDAGP